MDAPAESTAATKEAPAAKADGADGQVQAAEAQKATSDAPAATSEAPAGEAAEESSWLPYLDPMGVFRKSPGTAQTGTPEPAGAAAAAVEGAAATASEEPKSWASYLDPLGVFTKAPSGEAEDIGLADCSPAGGEVLRLEDFAVGRLIGIGGSAVVRFATLRSTGRHYALKVQNKRELLIRLKQKDPETRIRERRILPKLQHPFIVELLGAFQDPCSLYLSLEFVPGGELMARLIKEKKLSPDTARFYAAQVVEAFAYLHGQSVVYRSLKPEDVLLDGVGYIKLVDFGFAKELPEGGKTFTLCGTPEYLAPEVILNQGHGKPADWYSLGVLVYELTVGKPPFQGKDANEVYQNILAGKIKSPATADKEMKALVKGLLHSDPETRAGGRLGAEGIRTSGWFQDLNWQDLLEKRLPAPFKPSLSGDGDTSCYPEQEEPDAGEAAVGGDLDPKADIFRRLW